MIFIRGRPLRLLLSGVIQPCHASAQTTENQIFSPYKVLQKLFSSYIATVAHDWNTYLRVITAQYVDKQIRHGLIEILIHAQVMYKNVNISLT